VSGFGFDIAFFIANYSSKFFATVLPVDPLLRDLTKTSSNSSIAIALVLAASFTVFFATYLALSIRTITPSGVVKKGAD